MHLGSIDDPSLGLLGLEVLEERFQGFLLKLLCIELVTLLKPLGEIKPSDEHLVLLSN